MNQEASEPRLTDLVDPETPDICRKAGSTMNVSGGSSAALDAAYAALGDGAKVEVLVSLPSCSGGLPQELGQ